MRFWNTLVPIALLPIVMAELHFGLAAYSSKKPFGLASSSGHASLHWVILPAQNAGCLEANDQVGGFPTTIIPLGSPLSAIICGVFVTISYRLDRWFDDNGTSGECHQVYSGPSGVWYAHFATCVSPWAAIYFELRRCPSYVCEGWVWDGGVTNSSK
ncbi:uncharacterized protein EI90DRAFT_3085810 [Cantharellus anzutake]|uniref:uncharacterized protein n=1 Tax=Cantharellus anzutake TaxID=1750568 RepID=UPI0019083294|nr:uncharacterized protein EI90DRAFT_3085810 [Cantharellus anzutake]KAF8316963.1 hypothetical protein EI90DRAFT_3085810 [Cantharellus anzutake]